ncbi:beta-N-acetylhexosaminidase [Dactylosporangium darangshiense]|uniref:beta-N-acetylhexosaminidase n=1 Tax=Dactylosporangium darangshiense TaxID=579108 RepID=A0ABP8DT98_9ACTN
MLRFIDLLAVHKLNVLHLHLTDDQGWRLEIRRYPELTRVGAWRRESMVGSRQHRRFDGRPHGGYYTQDDIREIVAYAAERFVTVVPEIDIPGHSQAAIAAYPSLGNAAGPVEVSTSWGISSRVLNVADTTLDFYRRVFDEVLELFPGPYIGIGGDECPKEEWRASPHAQLSGAERDRVLGAQCNIWTEHLPSARAVDYAAFPRLCAFAETVWSAPERDLAAFRHRLATHLGRLDALGVEYRPDAGPLPWQTRPDAQGWPKDRAARDAELAVMTARIVG